MILNFKQLFPDGHLTNFVTKIKLGHKVHTIRKNGARWKPGMTIHFSVGARTKEYICFWMGTLKSTQRIDIRCYTCSLLPFINVDGRRLDPDDTRTLIANDGLDPQTFLEWFRTPENEVGEGEFMYTGWLLHWTDLKY